MKINLPAALVIDCILPFPAVVQLMAGKIASKPAAPVPAAFRKPLSLSIASAPITPRASPRST